VYSSVKNEKYEPATHSVITRRINARERNVVGNKTGTFGKLIVSLKMIRRRSPNENLFRAEFQLDPKTKNTPTAFFDLYLARKTPCVCFFISYIMYVLPRVSRLLFNVIYILVTLITISKSIQYSRLRRCQDNNIAFVSKFYIRGFD